MQYAIHRDKRRKKVGVIAVEGSLIWNIPLNKCCVKQTKKKCRKDMLKATKQLLV